MEIGVRLETISFTLTDFDIQVNSRVIELSDAYLYIDLIEI